MHLVDRDALAHRLEDAPGAVEVVPRAPITGRWWFWTGIGAVVVAGVVTGIVIASQPDPGGVVEWGRP